MSNDNWLYNNFDKNEVEFSEIRLIEQAALFGMGFTFNIDVPEPLVVSVEHWDDIKMIC